MPSLLRKAKSADDSVGKVIQESRKLLKDKSVSGLLLSKSAEVSSGALYNTFKNALLTAPLCLDYVCVAFFTLLISHYLPNFRQ